MILMMTWNQRVLWMSPILPPLFSCNIAMAFMWHALSHIWRTLTTSICSPTQINAINPKLTVQGSYGCHMWLLPCSCATLWWPSCDKSLTKERLKHGSMNFSYDGCNGSDEIHSPSQFLWFVTRDKMWTHKFDIKNIMFHGWQWPIFGHVLYIYIYT